MIEYITTYWKWLGLAALLCLVLLFAIWPELLPFQRKKKLFGGKQLMSANEMEFFGRIEKALPHHYIFPQVALSAIVDVNPALTNSPNPNVRARARGLRNKFAQKRLDYLICDKALNPVCIIELDDRSHVESKDAERDEMTRQAGHVTLRYWSDKARRPSVSRIKEDVLRVEKN